jgi:hypothetical protein
MCCLIRRHGWEDLLVFRRIKSKIKLRCVTAEAGAHDDCVYVTPEPGPVTCVAGLPLERISRLDGGAAGSSPPSSVSKSLSARCIYMRPRKGASTFERLSCLLSAARTITQIMLWRCSPTQAAGLGRETGSSNRRMARVVHPDGAGLSGRPRQPSGLYVPAPPAARSRPEDHITRPGGSN